MSNPHFFADVDLPFHVWVREHTPAGERWVLREATQASAHLAGAVAPDGDKPVASYTNCRPQPTLPPPSHA